jgi:Tol biopolymer transport system component
LTTRTPSPLLPLVPLALLIAALAGCGGSATAPEPRAGRNLVAFASDRDGTFDIFLYDLDALIRYNLPGLNSASAAERRPSLGSDGRVLAFAPPRAGGMGDWDILVYDIARAQIISLPAINSTGRDDEPAFTGDALALLFVRDTLGVRRIRFYVGPAATYRPLPAIHAPDGFNDWAPAPDRTGGRIAFVSDRGGRTDVFVYDTLGDSLLTLPDLASDATDTEPALTPDGRYLAFASNRAGGAGGFDLYLYDLEARAFIALAGSVNTAADERNPSISDDAGVIVFESDRADGLGQFDVWNHRRATGNTGQGAGQSSAGMDVEPSLRWP